MSVTVVPAPGGDGRRATARSARRGPAGGSGERRVEARPPGAAADPDLQRRTRCSAASSSGSPTPSRGANDTADFNGLENYRELWATTLFWESFRIGLVWTFSVTILQFFASLGLALLLNLDLRLRWLARTLALVPWAMPPVIVAIMWRMMLHPRSGPVNEILRELGFAGDTNWLGDFARRCRR